MAKRDTLSTASSLEAFLRAPEEEVVRYYNSIPANVGQSSRVKCLSSTVFAKSSEEVTRAEYDNQCLVWSVIDRREFCVPQPYRFFEHGERGYFLMEYLPGPSLADRGLTISLEVIQRVANAIEHLHTAGLNTGKSPGPPTGGYAVGFPWGQYEAEDRFATAAELETSLNKRFERYPTLAKKGHSTFVGLKDRPYTLCHLDLGPRNIISLQNGLLGIVDWATLAFYPPEFELAALSFTPGDDRFFNELKRLLSKKASREEVENAAKLHLVQNINMRNRFPRYVEYHLITRRTTHM